MRDFILDSLRYWVTEYHIDGFRFDLASILGRDQAGNLLENPPIVERIAEDPILRNTKIIAEAWDAAGARRSGFGGHPLRYCCFDLFLNPCTCHGMLSRDTFTRVLVLSC